VAGGVDANLRVGRPGQRLAVTLGYRYAHHQPVPTRQNVAVPAAPENRVSVTHEKPVASIGQRGWIVAAPVVECSQKQLVAPVVHAEEEPSVAASGIDRLKQEEVGPDLDIAASVTWSQLEVDDPPVGRVVWRDLDVQTSNQLLVNPGGAEFVPLGKRHASGNFDPRDFRSGNARGR
jgi:hypothetical protein